VLHEIEAMLGALARCGHANIIDLRRAPLTAADYDCLNRVLGEGEVSAELDALGKTRIRETAVPGVWWVRHHDTSDQVLGEFIEVASCPDLLLRPEQEIRAGQRLLRARLRKQLQVIDPIEIARRAQAMGLRPNYHGSFIANVDPSVKRGNSDAG